MAEPPTLPELGAAFSRFVDAPRLGNAEALPTFAESLDRHVRGIAREGMYRAWLIETAEDRALSAASRARPSGGAPRS